MKNLSSVSNNKDIATKEYIDSKVNSVPEEVAVSSTQPTGNNWKIWIDEDEKEEEYVEKSSISPTDVTLTPSMFIQSGNGYQCTISDARITTSSMVIINPSRASRSIVDTAEFEPDVEITTGNVTIYCTNQPSANIIVSYVILGGA